MLPAFLTTILFALSVIFGTRSARVLGGTVANFWRLLFATLLLAAWAHGWGHGVTGRAFPIFLLSGCIGFGLGDLAMYQAMPRLGSRLTLLLVQCLAAPFGALTEWLWLGTTLSGQQMFCAGIILAGVALALYPQGGGAATESSSTDPYSKNRAKTRRFRPAGMGESTPAALEQPGHEAQTTHHLLHMKLLWSGAIFGILAAFGQGFGAVISRKAFAVADLARQSIDGPTAAYQRILGGLAVGGLFLGLVKLMSNDAGKGTADLQTRPRLASLRAWPWVLLNGLAGPTLGVSCFQWALKTTPAGIVLPIVATTPLVGIPLAYLLEGDRTTPRALLGGCLAVLGAVALTQAH